jgi:peptide/nickel transport system substrate-binding protein
MSKSMGLTRRAFLARASACLPGVALAGAVGACSPALPTTGQPTAGGASGGVQPTSGAAPTADAKPRRGGTLHYGTIGDFATLEGQTLLPTALDTIWSVWDRLTTYDTSMQVQPMLAESWDISSDYTQIKLNLRKGVQFHTGRELTADDVKWSLLRLQDPKIGGTLIGRAQVMIGVDIPDKYTVIVKASRPWAEAFDFFEYVNIIDPVTLQSAGLSKPTGTGPFVFAEYVQGDHVRLARNTNYWRNDRPYLDEVVVSISRDAQASVVRLEAGALDVVGFGLPVTAAARLQTDPKYQVVFNTTAGASWDLLANCRLAPTNDRLVRQALNHALDRKRISETVWRGQARPEALPWSTTSPAYDAAKADSVDFDLDKARSLLTASGASTPNLELMWPTAIDDFATAAQIYQADLAKIGVVVTLKPTEPAAFVPILARGSYQGLALVIGAYGHLQPANLFQGTVYGPEVNYAGFKSDEYARLVNQVLVSTDPSTQRLLYSQLNDYLLDQSFVLPVTQSPQHLAARANVRGLRYDAHEALVLSEVWLT